MLDLNLLRVLEAMLQHRQVTAAARSLGLSQSALSSALARLRRHFGDPLFVKTGSGMLPTPRAQALAQPVREALALVRSCTEPARSFDVRASHRVIRFWMTDVGEMVFLPALMKRLRDLASPLRIETYQTPTSEIGERLSTGEIDLAVGYLPNLPANIATTPLFREHYVCMTSRDHVAARGSFTMKEFLAADHVMIDSLGSGHRIIERTLEKRGGELRAALRVPHFMVIPMIVANTDLVVTIPSRVASTFAQFAPVAIHPLPVRIASFDVSLYTHPRFADDPPVRWMRELMLELFGQLAPPKRRRSGDGLLVGHRK